jgi:hypothetical protein
MARNAEKAPCHYLYRCRKEEYAPEIIPDAGAVEKSKTVYKIF